MSEKLPAFFSVKGHTFYPFAQWVFRCTLEALTLPGEQLISGWKLETLASGRCELSDGERDTFRILNFGILSDFMTPNLWVSIMRIAAQQD
jgi:hypothetical protein